MGAYLSGRVFLFGEISDWNGSSRRCQKALQTQQTVGGAGNREKDAGKESLRTALRLVSGPRKPPVGACASSHVADCLREGESFDIGRKDRYLSSLRTFWERGKKFHGGGPGV
ncbi:hypothetical protein DRN74_06350 [Candidatus Micrarchaeota archaeon]|nr:MAG: hypothetical protein DRN74_06350 [Candidatus Micrarchaeota archaeon]